jgi:hypothetical protein
MTAQCFDEVMATIGHRRSLVNQLKTIRHLWLTSRCLLEEVDRQRHKAQVVFTHMDLQQELHGSRFTASPVQGRSERSTSSQSSQPFFSPLSSQLSQFHSCEETMTYHLTMSLKIHSLPFRHYLLYLWAWLGTPLLSAMTKMISRVCSAAQVIMRHNRRSQPLLYSSFIVKTVLTNIIITLSVLNTSATTV